LFKEIMEPSKDGYRLDGRRLEKLDTKVVARGERTGHAHIIEGAGILWGLPNSGDPLYFDADEDVEIRHEEHPPLALPKGAYRVIQQKTYDYLAEARRESAERRVVD